MVEPAAEWQILVFVMDCDVAAAFDRVSHHEIIRAELAMGVPGADCCLDQRIQVLCNTGEAGRCCDSGNSATRSVPQSDPCAADLFGAALDTPAARFCDMCQHNKMKTACGNQGMLVCCSSRTTAGSSRCRQESSKRWQERGTNC